MKSDIENFLKEYIELIDTDNYQKLYGTAIGNIYDDEIGEMTKFFLDNNVNPLNYMDEIPDCYLYTQPITTFVIPNNIKVIGVNAFKGCNFTDITIPKSVINIEICAFEGCKSLKHIYYNDTKSKWHDIKKGNFWDYNVPKGCTIHCNDGDININD